MTKQETYGGFFLAFGLMWLLTVTSCFTLSQLGSNLPTIAHFLFPFRSTRSCINHYYKLVCFVLFFFSLLLFFFCLFENKERTFCVVEYTPLS